MFGPCLSDRFSFSIILMGKKELVALLLMSSRCIVTVDEYCYIVYFQRVSEYDQEIHHSHLANKQKAP